VLRLSSDICPVSDFRANAAKIVERVQASRRPMIITQHGRSAAVLLGLEAYESLVDELELLRDVRTAEDQVLAERGRAHASVETRLRTINGR
jgi:prevent-host-death family protein